MDPTTFDRIARTFATRRLNRRDIARQAAAAGLAAGAVALTANAVTEAQPATPAPATPAAAATSSAKIEFLFVQSFQHGTLTPKSGAAGTFELTLEQGLGHTLFFSDRPERVVGATPTPEFLKGVPFAPGNPANAALVAEVAPGDEDIAVLELSNPRYDTASNTATYDVQPLADWERGLEMSFQEEPTDLTTFHPTFGAASLFIDDCPNGTVSCCAHYDYYYLECDDPQPVGTFTNEGFCYWWWGGHCIPCKPDYHQNERDQGQLTLDYWNGQCNATYSACNGICQAMWSDW